MNKSKLVLSEYIDTMEFFKKKKYLATIEIRKLSRSDRYKEDHSLLLSVPGIGCLTAMIFLTEIGDIHRFRNLNHLSSFVGLVPSTNSTGERERTSGITNRRNKLLRTSLVESAWVAIRTDPALMLAYQNYVKRMESQKAIVRIAKKLLSRILYVLKNKKPYVHCVTK